MSLLNALLAAAGIPLLLATWACHRACRDASADPARAWFTLAQQLGWLGAWGLLAWFTLGPAAVKGALAPWIATWPGHASMPLFALGLLVPPALLGAVLHGLRHEGSRHLRGVDRGWSVVRREAMLQVATWILPLPLGLCAVPAFESGHPTLGAGLAAAALATLVVLMVRRQALSGVVPHAVMSGEIRDRVFVIATHAGVTLRHLQVMPLGSQRLANAFAVRRDTVMLTDYVIEQLSRDELDAVLAHEMAHLQLGHPRQLGVALILWGGLAGLAATLGGTSLALALVPLGMVAVMAISRRIEFIADARALALGAEPKALITGLARLNRLNHIPIDWPRLEEWALTHPSTARRAERVAKASSLAPARVRELLANEERPWDRYAMPSALAEGRAYTTKFKNASNAAIGWTILVALAAIPALVASLHGALALAAPWRLAGLALSAAAALALCLALSRRIMFARLRALERAATPRLAAALPPGARGRFLGLAPDAAPRYYEGFTAWDVGLLALEPGRLDWSGEEARFTLSPLDVIQVAVVAGTPRWGGSTDVLLRWRRPDGLAGALRLTPNSARFGRSAEAARDLAAWIEAWMRSGDGASRAGAAPWLGAPPWAPVTSVAPRELLTARGFVQSWFLLAMLSAAVCAALGLASGLGARAGFVDVFTSGIAGHLLLMVPVLRHREPGSRAAAAEREPERRAA